MAFCWHRSNLLAEDFKRAWEFKVDAPTKVVQKIISVHVAKLSFTDPVCFGKQLNEPVLDDIVGFFLKKTSNTHWSFCVLVLPKAFQDKTINSTKDEELLLKEAFHRVSTFEDNLLKEIQSSNISFQLTLLPIFSGPPLRLSISYGFKGKTTHLYAVNDIIISQRYICHLVRSFDILKFRFKEYTEYSIPGHSLVFTTRNHESAKSKNDLTLVLDFSENDFGAEFAKVICLMYKILSQTERLEPIKTLSSVIFDTLDAPNQYRMTWLIKNKSRNLKCTYQEDLIQAQDLISCFGMTLGKLHRFAKEVIVFVRDSQEKLLLRANPYEFFGTDILEIFPAFINESSMANFNKRKIDEFSRLTRLRDGFLENEELNRHKLEFRIVMHGIYFQICCQGRRWFSISNIQSILNQSVKLLEPGLEFIVLPFKEHRYGDLDISVVFSSVQVTESKTIDFFLNCLKRILSISIQLFIQHWSMSIQLLKNNHWTIQFKFEERQDKRLNPTDVRCALEDIIKYKEEGCD